MDDIYKYRVAGNDFIGFSIQKKFNDKLINEWLDFAEIGMPENNKGHIGVFKTKEGAINYIKGIIEPIQYFYGPDFNEGKYE